jgi:hypothetical protein
MNKRTWATIKRDKEAARRQAAARPFAEKLAVLDRLRERARALRIGKPARDRA